MANEMKKAAPFGMKDKVGYMFGDFGNDFTFLLSSSFLMKFYTDVMGVNAAIVGMVMMIARFVDAFTDVGMGQIVDHSKPNKDGKFRPWIKRMCGPVAIASFLIYQSGLAGMPYGFKVAWLFVTYILWGSIFYTSINIPYGSMASAISSDPKDRADLSTWRNNGSTQANMVVSVTTPLVNKELHRLLQADRRARGSARKQSEDQRFRHLQEHFHQQGPAGHHCGCHLRAAEPVDRHEPCRLRLPQRLRQRRSPVHRKSAGHGGHAGGLCTLCFQAVCQE